jgi:CHAT domain-containing protein
VLCYFTTGVLARDIPLLRAIPAHNPLRAHLHTPGRTLLFAVTRDRLAVHDCGLDPNRLTTTSPRGHDPMRLLNRAVRQRLYATLVAPAAEVTTAKQLYLIPHGPLHHIPFAALIDQDEKPLARADRPGLAYAPSATLLRHHTLATASQPAATGPGLVVGYRGSDAERPLPYSEVEADAVAHLMEAEVWTGPESKKRQLRQTAMGRPFLHFACHGWFNEAEPMASYLETGHDERLTAQEVLLKWQLQAGLVTLSACQTGVSRILRGDEPMGLIRAFLYAGAKAVLVSQWAVADVATFLLMRRFYGQLGNGADTADLSQALSAAQQWLRQLTVAAATTVLAQSREEIRPQAGAFSRELVHSPLLVNRSPGHRPFAHPRFWAAFILVGGTRSIGF